MVAVVAATVVAGSLVTIAATPMHQAAALVGEELPFPTSPCPSDYTDNGGALRTHRMRSLMNCE